MGASALLTILIALAASVALAQRPPYQPAAKPNQPAANAALVPGVPPRQVYVDQKCRLLPDPGSLAPGRKVRPKKDSEVCHLEGVFDTKHREDQVVGNEQLRSIVEVYEQQYVLQNVTPQTEVFVIEQPAVKGWTIEGDPPPFRVAGGTAYYRAWVQPGEVVRLHVGIRRVTPLKTKVFHASGPAHAASAAPRPLAATVTPGGSPGTQ